MNTLRLYGAGLLVALLLTLAACGNGGGGTGGGGSNTSFTISLDPASLTVQQGSSGTTTLTLNPQNGFTGMVSLSLVAGQDQVPAGLALSPQNVQVSGTSPVNQTLTLSAQATTPAGTYRLKVRGTSRSLTREADLTVTVSASGGGGSGAGTTWTVRAPGFPLLSGVTYGNGTFVAVGERGSIFTSPDGVSWTRRTSGTNQSLYGVTYGNGTFVAVGESGTVLTSSNGVSWTWRTSEAPSHLVDVTYGYSTFVAVGSVGTILTSPDGVSWTARTSGTSYVLSGVTYGNGTFVAVGSYGTILTSP